MCEPRCMNNDLTISALRDKAGISKSYASEILSGKRRPSAALACRIYRATGHATGPIAGMSDAEIEAVERGVALLSAA